MVPEKIVQKAYQKIEKNLDVVSICRQFNILMFISSILLKDYQLSLIPILEVNNLFDKKDEIKSPKSTPKNKKSKEKYLQNKRSPSSNSNSKSPGLSTKNNKSTNHNDLSKDSVFNSPNRLATPSVSNSPETPTLGLNTLQSLAFDDAWMKLLFNNQYLDMQEPKRREINNYDPNKEFDANHKNCFNESFPQFVDSKLRAIFSQPNPSPLQMAIFNSSKNMPELDSLETKKKI